MTDRGQSKTFGSCLHSDLLLLPGEKVLCYVGNEFATNLGKTGTLEYVDEEPHPKIVSISPPDQQFPLSYELCFMLAGYEGDLASLIREYRKYHLLGRERAAKLASPACHW